MELDRLKQIPIRDYLASNGIFPSTQRVYYGMYLSSLREERTPSMKVDFNKNLWIDYGLQVGGSVIDMVMQFEKCSFCEAVSKLEAYSSGYFIPAEDYSRKAIPLCEDCEPGITVQKCCDLQHPALIRYLSGRCVDTQIAALHCKEVHYRIGAKTYFAPGFANDSGGYELRNRYFKGSTSKDITMIRAGNNVCLVFEGFMDYLSHLTLEGVDNCEESVIVLNSTSNLKIAIPLLSGSQEVHSYLDNDKTGQGAFDRLARLPAKLIGKSNFFADYKDLNEYLCARKHKPP